MVKRVKTVQESDLRMLGNLARNIQRVLPVTQADIDAAAALGKGWVVWKVFEVSEPLDNLRGGTQLIIRQNNIQPGQNVRRVIFVAGPGGQTVVIRGTDYIVLPDAIANSLSYVKAFGGTEQRNLPDNYIQRDYIYIMSGAYLLTDIVPTYDYKIEMDFGTTTVSASKTVLGGRTATYGGMEIIIASSKNFVVDAFGTSSSDRYGSSVTAQNNTRYKFTYDNQVATLESGGSTLFTNTMTGTTANGAALCINGNNDNGSVTASSVGEIYLYSFKVWNAQGELVADYVPAVQKGTVPVVGFYDTVSGTFKTATKGTIAAGPEAVPTPDAPVDIVSNNGVLKASPNLVDFNEIRINGTTWASADKTKGFEVEAAVYGKGVGSSVITNANCFGVFVPCKQGESVSINFFDYTVYGSRCYYCEVDADGEATTTPVQYATAQNVLTQQTFTITQSDSIGFVIEWYITSEQVRNYTKENYMVVRGTTPPTAYMPYGQIYTDDTVETINAHTSNIFNKNDTASIGNWYASTALKITSAGANQTLVMRAKPGATYYYKHCSVTGGGRAFYTEVEDWDIGSDCSAMVGATTTDKDEVRSITVSENAKWVFFIYGRSGQTATFEEQLADYMVSLTPLTSDTQYTPYYDGGTATAEMLLKVGDYQDEQEILSGAITRNVGAKVLDGTEVWFLSAAQSVNRYRVQIIDAVGGGSRSAVLSTHFEYISTGQSVGGAFLATRYLYLIPDQTITTVNDFKQWLADQYAAGTPVIVVYPLAEPTTESVAGQVLQVTSGDNILEITQASLNNLELEAQYNAAVSLTIQEVEDANLDNNVTVTIQ